jgi:hypothetical protein
MIKFGQGFVSALPQISSSQLSSFVSGSGVHLLSGAGAQSGDIWRWRRRCACIGSDIGAPSVKVFHEHDIRFVEIVLHVYKRMAVRS